MATILASGYPGAVPHIPGGLCGEFTCFRANYDAASDGGAINDTIKIGRIPKDFVVVGGFVEVIVAGTATLNVDVGITGSLVLFGSDVDGGATGFTAIAAAAVSRKASETAHNDLLLLLQTAGSVGALEMDVVLWGMVLPGKGKPTD